MTPAKELPIVIEKSQEEVEQIVALVHASNLPEGTKPFVIGPPEFRAHWSSIKSPYPI